MIDLTITGDKNTVHQNQDNNIVPQIQDNNIVPQIQDNEMDPKNEEISSKYYTIKYTNTDNKNAPIEKTLLVLEETESNFFLYPILIHKSKI